MHSLALTSLLPAMAMQSLLQTTGSKRRRRGGRLQAQQPRGAASPAHFSSFLLRTAQSSPTTRTNTTPPPRHFHFPSLPAKTKHPPPPLPPPYPPFCKYTPTSPILGSTLQGSYTRRRLGLLRHPSSSSSPGTQLANPSPSSHRHHHPPSRALASRSPPG